MSAGYGLVFTVLAALAGFAAAHLLTTGIAPDAKSALKQLRELRPGVRLHPSQRKLLDAFAEELVLPSSPRPADGIEEF